MKSKKFKMPTKSDLKGRSSTISNAFAISITPFIRPMGEELDKYYSQLRIKEGQCAYCLGDGNGRDHLKPLVNNGMPTGFITDIHNLVPCCQKCNSSKGSKSLRDWYMSEKNISRLKKLGLNDEKIKERFDVLCAFEDMVPSALDYEAIVGKEMWDEYKMRREESLARLKDDQKFCDEISKIIINKIQKK